MKEIVYRGWRVTKRSGLFGGAEARKGSFYIRAGTVRSIKHLIDMQSGGRKK